MTPKDPRSGLSVADLEKLGGVITSTLRSEAGGTRLALIEQRTQGISESVGEIRKDLKEAFVTKLEFDPVKRVVFGLVSLVLLTVGGAVIALAITK